MLEGYADVLTVYEICDIFHICKTTAYKWLRTGEIKNCKIGEKIYIPKQYVIDKLFADN